EKVREGMEKKGLDGALVAQVLELDEKRRELLKEVENLRAERNEISEGAGKPSRKQIERATEIKETLQELEPELKKIEKQFETKLFQLPNLPAEDVPFGKDEKDNVEMKTWGEPTSFSFKPKSYWDLGETLGIIDTERAAKVSGSRFGYLKSQAVFLEFALVQLALEKLRKEGFTPIVSPVMIGEEAMRGMGYLEHGGEEETYHFKKDNLYLVGTSEQAVGPMHMNETLAEEDLPLRYVSFSTCFRREAGSYGRDTKGIFRVHQFDKLEMFSFAKPEQSDKEHEFLLSLQEELMQELNIPYQVTKMCTGDLGNPAARKYDINAWFPAQSCYRETHSTSTCTDFQARRLNIKYRQSGDRESAFVHTLNGTAFAVGRTLLAILENYQQEDGSVKVPEALQNFVGRELICKR
ncbi:MAG: serine--tRNA ligase, partial [Patescibacteria group bacterium]